MQGVDQERIMQRVNIDHVRLAGNVLGLGLQLVCKRGLFGGLKPTAGQIEYCYGFCRAMSLAIGHDIEDEMAFCLCVFWHVFGKKGGDHIMWLMKTKPNFVGPMQDGWEAFVAWRDDKRSPIPPSH